MSSSRREASGEFSHDPLFDPAELFEILEFEENATRVLEAMRTFARRSDPELFGRAVAVYVRSARARGAPVEGVLAALQTVADEVEGGATPGFTQRDTPMRNLVLRGVLLAFYGMDVVEREDTARDERVERRTRPREKSPPASS